MTDNFPSLSLLTKELVKELQDMCAEVNPKVEVVRQLNDLSEDEQKVYYEALKQMIRDDMHILMIYFKGQKLLA